MSESLKKQAVQGVFWTFAQQFSVQIINFVVQIILARLLLPEMFGLIAMLAVFIAIGQMLMDGGMTSSVIRMKNPDQLDYSTVFMTNMLISIVAYLLTFIGAPFIADFYHQPILSSLLRVYALSFVIRAFMAVHIAKLTKEMNFKKQMTLQVPSTIFGAIVGVGMALKGFGAWSLVGLNLAQVTLFTLQCWLRIPWRPSFIFNKRRFVYHFNFGYKLTISGFLDTVYRNIYMVVIGKAFTPTIVGFFNQAETMRRFPTDQLSRLMDKVTYPLFSNIKSDEELRKVYRSTMKLVFFLVVPLMMALIVTGKEFFYVLFGEKWLAAVPFFQILAFASIWDPLSAYNLNILKVKGRSDLFLRLEIIKKILGVIAVFAALPFGIHFLVLSYMVVSHINAIIDMAFSGKFIQYGIFAQLKDCAKVYAVGAFSLGTAWLLRFFLVQQQWNAWLILITVSLVFAVFYFILVYLFEREILGLVRKVLKRS